MMKNILRYWIGLTVLVFAFSCEDLEDTYDEFGETIRYIGKCTDVEVQPGWERLMVTWKTNTDVAIKHTKITWQSKNDAKPFVKYIEHTPATASTDLLDTTLLTGLQDAVYTITVSNISADSTESLVETAYARPYTQNHEALRTFTRGIVNFYRLDNKLVIVLDKDNENLIELVLHYWGTDGQEYTYDIKEHMNDQVKNNTVQYMRDYIKLLPERDSEISGIDFSKEIKLTRKGILTGCMDEVPFEDEVLDLNEQVFSASINRHMTGIYGEDWKSHINEITELDLDYDISSFLDLMYFPNLKKVNLGKNRFMAKGQTQVNPSTTDDYKSLMTLQFLKDTRPDFSVERYNNHYFQNKINGKTYMEVLQNCNVIDDDLVTNHNEYDANYQFIPAYTPLETIGWQMTCTDSTKNNYKNNGVGWLVDNDPTTYFEPDMDLNSTIYELEFDMQTPTTVRGFKVTQPAPSTATNLTYLLGSIQIECSEDGYVWENITYTDGAQTLGKSLGEITFIPIPEALQKPVRYIRLTMASNLTGQISGGTSLYCLRFGDVVPYE